MAHPRIVFYDFDGVMTDNRVLLSETGQESVFVNRADGLAVERMAEMGIEQVIVSTETNPVVTARAKKLGIPALQSVKNKREAVEGCLGTRGMSAAEAVFVGNDTNDAEAMRFVGWPICPADSHENIRALSKVVLRAKGGGGVARELYDLIQAGAFG